MKPERFSVLQMRKTMNIEERISACWSSLRTKDITARRELRVALLAYQSEEKGRKDNLVNAHGEGLSEAEQKVRRYEASF
jgi:hypothetical protein